MSTLSASAHAAAPAERELSPRAFANSREHLRAELAWLDLLLKRELLLAQAVAGKPGPVDEFAGLYVSDAEMQRYLEGDAAPRPRARGEALQAIEQRLESARRDIERRVALTLERGGELRLPLLAARFGLSSVELRALLLCLAPDVDVRFQRCLAYLQNDVGKKRPTVQLLARLCEGLGDVLDVWALLAPLAPLARHRLLVLPERAAAGAVPLPVQQPVVPPVVIDFLSAQDRVDERTMDQVELVRPSALPPLGSYGRHHEAIRERIGRELRAGRPARLAYVGGPPGSMRARLVEQIALDGARALLRVRAKNLLARAERVEESLALLARDARLHGALIHLQDADEVVVEEGPPSAQVALLRGWLGVHAHLGIILTGSRRQAELAGALGQPLAGFDLPHPSIAERGELWSRRLQSSLGEDSRGLIEGLASKFRFTPGQIDAAVRAAGDGAGSGADGELQRCCREMSNQRLSVFARKVAPVYRWDDIVLPAESRRQLQDVCNSVRNRSLVYGSWGFESRFSVGNGLNILFAGPSGTGKTMSAEIIAGDLELDLYKIDLSCVVSKYVGETERNLARIFDEAETSNSILFFDEADALFGKRSEVKDAHDRYANIEINYLLQKLDDYAGIVVLATNFKGNVDAAFTRRLSHVIDFPAPDAELRRRIWKGVFPSEVPLADDVDFDFLARQFQLNGGHIKNIALNAAFLAAADAGSLCMAHLIRATKREYQKLGKLCSKSELGPYLKLVRDEGEA